MTRHEKIVSIYNEAKCILNHMCRIGDDWETALDNVTIVSKEFVDCVVKAYGENGVVNLENAVCLLLIKFDTNPLIGMVFYQFKKYNERLETIFFEIPPVDYLLNNMRNDEEENEA